MKHDFAPQLQAALGARYTIERELGRGGMATVFLARDAGGSPVALKLLNPELASTVGAERFRREIRVAAMLRHPNILGVLDSGVASVPTGGGSVDFLWFTMPFVEGRNVWERFESEGALPYGEVVRIGTAVAEALDYAHQQGVVHRDIKPDNIMLAGDQVLVADFGVARAVSEVAEKLTATGMVVGTPTYMSPEQASGDREIDGRTDVFALGCVLYELLAGEAPFHGPTPQATLMRRFTGPPRKLRPVVDVPEVVEAALMRSLARDPKERFATAGEFAAALAGQPARPAAPAVSPGGPAATPVRPGAPAVTAAGGDAATGAKKGCLGMVVLLLGFGMGAAALTM
ncbi:MAG TPA: serine/threonine-protein kinase [Gemmatimonadales bacterium]|nr:serine/threonine-protein kinase [Gemmatimonadales bacterium]